MIIYSFYPNKREANKFAKYLIKEGAGGVAIGPIRTSSGYPVFSEVPDAIAETTVKEFEKQEIEEGKRAAREYKEVTGEEYDFELSNIPSSWHLAGYEMSRTKPTFSQKEAIALVRDELRKLGIKGVRISVSKYMGNTPGSPYADATLLHRVKGGKDELKINLYPTVLYQDEDYIRDVARHEAGHILEGYGTR